MSFATSYQELVETVERVAATTGVQMNKMRARQEAGRMLARLRRFFPVHVSAPIVERTDEKTGVVRRFVQKPGRTYRKPTELPQP